MRHCQAALTPAWAAVQARLRSCSVPMDLTVPCPAAKWGATMTRGGTFHRIAEDGHLARHGLTEALLNTRLVGVNGGAESSLATVVSASHGPQVTLTVLVPRQRDVVLVPPAPVQPRDLVLEANAAAALRHHQETWVVQSNAKIAKSKAQRQVYQDSAFEMADKLISLYPLTTANGERVPRSIYRCICFSSCEEDECIRRLYNWVSHQDAVAGKDAEDVEDAEDDEDADEDEYAVACKDAEQSDLSTDVEEGEDAEEEVEEMLDVNALD